MKLFVYGTLADPAALGRCAGRPLKAAPLPAQLLGFRRVRLRGARYPTLRRAPGALVQGVIIRVNADMLVRLQAYESVRYQQVPCPPAQRHRPAPCPLLFRRRRNA